MWRIYLYTLTSKWRKSISFNARSPGVYPKYGSQKDNGESNKVKSLKKKKNWGALGKK